LRLCFEGRQERLDNKCAMGRQSNAPVGQIKATDPLLLVFPRVGEEVAEGTVGVDLDRLVVSRMLIQASSGGGKSWLARYIIEQTHGRIQQVIVDSEGEFASLRERYDFVLASAGFRSRGIGDLPAAPESAGALCKGLFELGLSAVLDVSDLSKSSRRRFVKLFVDALMALPQEMWRPLLFILDEAQDYAPERGSKDAESLEAVVALCSQGRKRGFCPVLLTQRLSKLHKDAAAEMLNVFVGLTQLDVDVNRAADTLGFGKELRETLRMLNPDNGEMYAYGPALSERGVVLVRSGTVQTSHPEPGKVSTQAPPPPPKEMAGVLEQLHHVLNSAGQEAYEAPAQDGDFRRRVDREAKKRTQDLVAEAVKKAEKPLRERIAYLEETLASAQKHVLALATDIGADVSPIPSLGMPLVGQTKQLADPTETVTQRNTASKRKETAVTVRAPRPVKMTSRKYKGLPGARRRILATLLSMEALGIDDLGHKNLAVFSGQGPRSSAYAAHLAALRKQGYVQYPEPSRASLTSIGRTAALDLQEEETGEPLRGERPRSLDGLHSAWYARLPEAQSRLLSVLIASYPGDVSHKELARLAGQSPNSSAYAAHRASLKRLGLIEYPRPGRARVTKLLFPEGLV
jgi:hypothetical protein